VKLNYKTAEEKRKKPMARGFDFYLRPNRPYAENERIVLPERRVIRQGN